MNYLPPSFRLSPRLQWVCRGLFALSLILTVVYLGLMIREGMVAEVIAKARTEIDPEHRQHIREHGFKSTLVTGLAWVAILKNVLIYGGMARLFYVLSKGHVFSMEAVKALRGLGILILIYAALQIVHDTLIIGALTYDSPPGHRITTVSLSTYDMMMVLFGGLFLIIGHIYVEAVRLAEDDGQYV